MLSYIRNGHCQLHINSRGGNSMTNRRSRRSYNALTAGILAFLLTMNTSYSQNTFEDAIKQLSSDNVKGYLQPLLDGFGANLNSGYMGSASMKTGLHLRLHIIGMATVVGDKEKTYNATPPQPFSQSEVETATIFGGRGAIVTGPGGLQYQFQNGQINTSWIPFVVPQLTFGNVFGTQGVIRFAQVSERENVPEISLFGFGVRHSISRYLPHVPVDLAAGLFYQTFSVGDIMEAKTTAFTAQVSKSFQMLTLYGGLQYESSSVDLSYTYTGPLPPGDTSDRNISLSLKGENNLRLSAGFGLSLGVLFLQADVNLGKVTVLSAGLGVGI